MHLSGSAGLVPVGMLWRRPLSIPKGSTLTPADDSYPMKGHQLHKMVLVHPDDSALDCVSWATKAEVLDTYPPRMGSPLSATH